MSDRIDAEQKRDEQRIMEQRLQTQRLEIKRQQATQSFQSVVSQVAHAKHQENQKNDGKQMQQSTANQRLLARRGIDNNDFAHKMLGDGDHRLVQTRENAKRQDGEIGQRRAARDKAALLQGAKSGMPAVNPNESREPSGGKKDEGQGRVGDEARREGMVGQQNGPSLLPLSGVSPKQGSGGSTGAPNVQRIIDEIVKAVRKGVDAKGMGVIHIELKDHVLAGASLSIHSAAEGITLKIRTPDENINRLLSSGSTANELSDAFKNKRMILKGLEVNDHKVIR